MHYFKRRSGKDKVRTTAPPRSVRESSQTSQDPPRASEPGPSTRSLNRCPPSLSLARGNSAFAISASPSQSLEQRPIDPLGLTTIYEPATPPLLNIIFIHGLGGTSQTTWAKGRDLELFWPQKWLPLEPGIRAARILTFGYSASSAATGPASVADIVGFAKELLFEMKFAKDGDLEELELGQRPIIFIAHSMGGLVVKQAYILGQYDHQYSSMVSSISAILFLATPHRGSDLADTLSKILALSTLCYTPKLYIAELRSRSKTVEALNESFRHIAPKLDIFSFYETLQTYVVVKNMMVVKKDSATLGYEGEISRPLGADHHTVCKFDSTQDPNYISVRNALKTLVDNILSTGKQGVTQMKQLETLLAVSETYRDDLEFFLKRRAPGTCQWVLSNPSFIEWIDKRGEISMMLWLHALPASGKSVLSSFLVNHLQESVCLYYFFRFGDDSKRSLSTCLRTIAFQAAERLPQFRRALKDMRLTTESLEKVDPKTIWEKVFIGILFKMRFTTTMYWIIDALDESDHPKLLLDLMQSIPQSSAPIKALLVSRHTPELIDAFERLSITVPVAYLPLEDTKKDIRTYVETEAQYIHASVEFKSDIVEKLVSGAVGNFLWASLALAEVNECHTQKDLDGILKGIPSGMEQLYQRMESSIIRSASARPQNQKLAQLILTWTTCSRRPLALKELEQALQPQFLVPQDLWSTISHVCGQFVTLDSIDHLVMVHQTARDYITTTNSALGVNVTEGHEQIFAKCLSMLEQNHQRWELARRPNNQKVTENQDFLCYAATSWAYHLNMISPQSDAPLLLLSKFLKGKSVLGWITLLASENQLKVLVYSSKILSLYVRRKSGCYVATNPLLHRLQDLDLLESWSTDFIKILGNFGRNLTANPSSIYLQIPPFCPTNSQIYKLFKQYAPNPCPLTVGGGSQTVWDDSLAKLSLGPGSQNLAVLCSGDYFAVLTAGGVIFLFDSITFEIKRTLQHVEQVCAMSFSTCSNLLVSYGFRTTKVWSVKTGHIMYEIRNPRTSRALTIAFSAGNTQVVIGSNDRMIRVVRLTLTVPNLVWSIMHPDLLKAGTFLDRPVHDVPWRIAFNPDASYVAVSYRGAPICVWGLDPPEFIGCCMRNQEDAENPWAVVDQIIWHPGSEEILGLYMGGDVFRWNPYDNTQQELKAAASILASSPDGKFFATGDVNGIIKLYNFHHFALVYQLSYENIMNGICFSPDAKRLYDVRGQFCNIWQPNALVRIDEQDVEVGSDMASVLARSVSEVFAEMRDQITAVAIQFRGNYQAIGNATGLVSIVDSSEDNSKGDYNPIELWQSSLTLPIEHLCWSGDGNYLACIDLTGNVAVKKVQLENDQTWTVEPAFDVKLKANSESIRQILLNKDGTALFVKNGMSATVWSRAEHCSKTQQKSIKSPNTKWIKHPTDSNLLLSFSSSILQVYLWDDLSEVAVFNIDRPQLWPSPGGIQTSYVNDKILKAVKISNVFIDPAINHFLIDTVVEISGSQKHFTFVSECPGEFASTRSPSKSPMRTITPTLIPSEIQRQIEIPLGIFPMKRLIFIDKEYSVCSWRLGANPTTEKIQRHHLIPTDWFNATCLNLCALLANGTFLIPHDGHLKVIKSTEICH